MKQIWRHCHVATMAGGEYAAIERAALVTRGSISNGSARKPTCRAATRRPNMTWAAPG